MDYVGYNTLAIIWIIAIVGIFLGSMIATFFSRGSVRRPMWNAQVSPVWISHHSGPRELPVSPKPSAEPKDEKIEPQLEAWIAAELDKDFVEEKETVMHLQDINTGIETVITVKHMWGFNDEEVTDPRLGKTALGQDEAGTWIEVDLTEASWDRPTIH